NRLEIEEMLNGERRGTARPAGALLVDRDPWRTGIADLGHDPAERIEQVVAKADALATEHDHLGVKEIDEPRDMPANSGTCVGENLASCGVAGARRRSEIGRPLAVGKRVEHVPRLHEATVGAEGLEAAVAATLTCATALFEIMSELAGGTSGAAVEPP